MKKRNRNRNDACPTYLWHPRVPKEILHTLSHFKLEGQVKITQPTLLENRPMKVKSTLMTHSQPKINEIGNEGVLFKGAKCLSPEKRKDKKGDTVEKL